LEKRDDVASGGRNIHPCRGGKSRYEGKAEKRECGEGESRGQAAD